jgi:hypothetical protein
MQGLQQEKSGKVGGCTPLHELQRDSRCTQPHHSQRPVTTRRSKLLNLHVALGNVPESQFMSNRRKVSADSQLSSVGIVEVSRLLKSKRDPSSTSCPSSIGILPAISLKARKRELNLVRRSSSVGIVGVMP